MYSGFQIKVPVVYSFVPENFCIDKAFIRRVHTLSIEYSGSGVNNAHKCRYVTTHKRIEWKLSEFQYSIAMLSSVSTCYVYYSLHCHCIHCSTYERQEWRLVCMQKLSRMSFNPNSIAIFIHTFVYTNIIERVNKYSLRLQ